MSPSRFECPHPCCVDDGKPHAHLMPPDVCGDCLSLNRKSDRAAELENRALRIASKKHPAADLVAVPEENQP